MVTDFVLMHFGGPGSGLREGSELLAWLGLPLSVVVGLSLGRVLARQVQPAPWARAAQRCGVGLQLASLVGALFHTVPWILGGADDLLDRASGIAVVASTLLGAPAIAAWLYLGEWIEAEEQAATATEARDRA